MVVGPLKLLLVINIILLLSLLLLLAFLLIKKTNDRKRNDRKKNLKKKLRPTLFTYLNEGNEIKTRLFQREQSSYQVAEELLYEYQSRAKGDDVSERVSSLVESYLADYYRKLLGQERWSTRMNALYAIENFKIASLEVDVWEYYLNGKLTRVETIEMNQQLRVLASLQSENLLKYLYYDGVKLHFTLYKDILRRYKPLYFDKIISQYDKAVDPLKLAILALFAEKRDLSYLPLVERELENGHLNIRIQALKVILSFGYTSNLALLSMFSKSSLWEERMMFGKIAAVFKKDRFKPLLVELIGDESWWVRNAAGEALAQYQDGELILTHILATNEDAFARDMAKQWLGGGKTR